MMSFAYSEYTTKFLLSVAFHEAGLITGHKGQPESSTVAAVLKKLTEKSSWPQIFPGVASVQITANGIGPTIELRLTKNEGTPVQIVPEGTAGASVVAVRRVNELGFYNLGLRQIAEKIKISEPKTLALIRHYGLQNDPAFFKIITIGRQSHKRYSQAALLELKNKLSQESPDIDAIWLEYGARKGTKKGK